VNCLQGGYLQYKDETWSDCSKAGLAGILQHTLHVKINKQPTSIISESLLVSLHWNLMTGACFTSTLSRNKVVLFLPLLLFFSLHFNAATDPSSRHGSCPVIEGEKWSATKWIHVRPFDAPLDISTNAPCSDTDELCPTWAALGGCYNNPTDTMGTDDIPVFCPRSCGLCEDWINPAI
jgi:hypothetical protein